MPNADRSFLRPGLWAGVSAAAGSAAGLSVSRPGALSFALAALSAALAMGSLLPRKSVARARRAGLALAFFAVGAVAGLGSPRPHRTLLLDRLAATNEPVHFVGTLDAPIARHLAPPRWRSTEPQPRATLLVSIDRVEQERRWIPSRAKVLLGAEDARFQSFDGDGVEGVARLGLPRAPTNPGEADGRPRLRRAAVAYVGSLARGALASVSLSGGFPGRAERFRRAYVAFVRAHLGPGDRAALVSALAVGERGGVSRDLADAFSTAGLAHLLAISGLHLAVAVLLLVWLLRRLFGLIPAVNGRISPKRLSAILAVPATVFYVALIGAPASAVRAGVGLSIYLFGRAAGRPAEVYSTLGWTLAAIAIIDPPSLFSAATQLSFCGVFGIAYFTPRLRELVPLARPAPTFLGKLREGALMLALVSLGATLATAPLTAAYFQRASLVSGVANILSWPAAAVIVPAGALSAILFALAPPLAVPVVHLAGFCAWALAGCVRLFAAWPMAALKVAPPQPLEVAAYLLLVIALANLRRWHPRLSGSLAALGATALVLQVMPWRSASGKLEVTFLSVGQADAAVLRFPHGRTMVVDAGGERSMLFDAGDRVVAPFLRFAGGHRIDVLAATHPHPDHIGGMPALFARYPVAEMWTDGLDRDPAQAALDDLARHDGARLVSFPQGLTPACPNLAPLARANPRIAALGLGDPRCRPPPIVRRLDGVRIEILNPLGERPHGAWPELSVNDNSLVLRVTYGRVRFLLTGDLESEGEALLLASGYDLSADVLKAPHHGSSTSSTPAFVRAVHPSHVVFSVGENNRFGFPRPEVVERYERAHSRLWRTDEGAITFVTDGRALDVRQFQTGVLPSVAPAAPAARPDP